MNTALQPSLQVTFSGLIWKIETDEKTGLIGIETRDPATHTASFSAYNYQTGQCCFKEKVVENSWWRGLDKVCHGMLFLHGYSSENKPERKGIIALDCLTGHVKWEQYNTALEYIVEEGIIAYSTTIRPKRLVLLSAETGDQPGTGVSNCTLVSPHRIYPDNWHDPLLLPAYLPPGITGPVLHARHNGNACWSFHVQEAAGLAQCLLIERGGVILLTDYLARNIQKLNPEAFFIEQNHLFCVRNRSEIVSYLV